jgi:integrase
MLTETFCKTVAPPAKGSEEHTDSGPGGQRGLILTVTAGGVRTFSVRYRLRGERHRIPLGRVGEINLRGARRRAAEIMASVGAGVSPHRIDTRPMEALFEDFMKERELILRRPDIDAALWRNHLAGPLVASWRQPQDVSSGDIDRLFAGLIAKGIAENGRRSVHRVLKQFFEWLVRREIIEASPVAVRPPAPRVQRETVPDVPTMRAVWRWACSADSGAAGAPIALICLTGLRQREASQLRWSEIFDLDSPEARLVIGADRMKAGRDHLVPLSPQAVALLKAQEPVRGWSKFVFPARRISGAAFVDRPTGANLPEQLRLSGVSGGAVVHDLRKGMAGGMASLGIPPHVISLCLSHSPGRVFGQTTSIYLKADYAAERRAALEAWAGLVCGGEG